jgi:hypothetical protein
MRIGYLTLDEVNSWVAEQLAYGVGLDLLALPFRESSGTNGCDGVLVDLDFLPRSDKQKLVSMLLDAPPQMPVVVHGWNLSRAEIKSLRAKGIKVCRRLDEKPFRQLRRAILNRQRATKNVRV